MRGNPPRRTAQERNAAITIIPFPGGNGEDESRLEAIEEKCLNYLQQSANPLVPVHTLAEYCRRGESGIELGEPELEQFLRAHEQVQVVDGPGDIEPVSRTMFREARAILAGRVPDTQELARLMREQLDGMAGVLEKALSKAAETGDDDACEQVRAALERTHALRARMEQFLS